MFVDTLSLFTPNLAACYLSEIHGEIQLPI